MSDRDQIIQFIEEFWEELVEFSDNDCVFQSIGIEGDDASDFMDQYAARFNVDLSEYRWYFHHGEEGINLGGLFYAPPYRRVDHIPLTIEILVRSAQVRRWNLIYPDHALPRRRFDIAITKIALLLFIIALGAVVFFTPTS